MAFNILVVDDSSVMRSLIIQTIKLSSIKSGDIFEASNGEEGLQILKNNWLDLAVIDLNMPKMDGMELLNYIRTDPQNVDLSIIMVTTESHPNRIKLIKNQNTTFVHKPFTPEHLKEEINSLMNK